MDDRILGLHHITAIANNAQQNYDFYTRVLGLRLVKRTVNFDDPGTYHFYFGDKVGTPGGILTFFPWEGVGKGRNGSGMATEIGYSVPGESLEFWADRFKKLNVKYRDIDRQFGERYLSFQDPDGLNIDLVANDNDSRVPWETPEIKADVALRGFHSIALTVKKIAETAEILTDIFGYKMVDQQGRRFRFTTDATAEAAIVDLIESPDMPRGNNAAGTNHHVAFRVKDDKVLMRYREKILAKGFNITPRIDRDYFFSLYFREPGGVLFELATDNPGFAVDETVDALGSTLKLPKQYEDAREEIEKTLPDLKISSTASGGLEVNH